MTQFQATVTVTIRRPDGHTTTISETMEHDNDAVQLHEHVGARRVVENASDVVLGRITREGVEQP